MNKINWKFKYIFLAVCTISIFIGNYQSTNAQNLNGVSIDVTVAKNDNCSTTLPTTYEESVILQGNAPTSFYKCAVFNIRVANNSTESISNSTLKFDYPNIGQPTIAENYGSGGQFNAQFNGNTIWQKTNYRNVGSNSYTGGVPSDFYGQITASSSIAPGTFSDLQIAITYDTRAVNLGTFLYNGILTYRDAGGNNLSISDNASLTINGTKSTYATNALLGQNANLTYYPNESDKDNYYYHQYAVSSLPGLAKDQIISNEYIRFDLPAGAQVVGNGTNTTYEFGKKNNSIFGSNVFTVRFPKSTYQPNQSVTLTGQIYCRSMGEASEYQCGSPLSLTNTADTVSVFPQREPGEFTTTTVINQGNIIRNASLKNGQIDLRALHNINHINANAPIAKLSVLYNVNDIVWTRNGVQVPAKNDFLTLYSGNPFIYGSNLSGEDASNPLKVTSVIHYADGDVSSTPETGITRLTNGIKTIQVDPKRELVSIEVVYENVPAVGRLTEVGIDGRLSYKTIDYADKITLEATITAVDYDGTPIKVDGQTNLKISKETLIKDDDIINKIKIANTATPSGAFFNSGSVAAVSTSFSGATGDESILNPEIDIVMPNGITFASTNITLDEQLAPPVITKTENYDGLGNNLVRIKFTGNFANPFNLGSRSTVSYNLSKNLKAGSYPIKVFISGDNDNFSNKVTTATNYMSVIDDTTNVDRNVNTTKLLGYSSNLTVIRAQGLYLYDEVKSPFSSVFADATNIPQGTMGGRINLEYNGGTALNNIELVTIIPNEADGVTKWGALDGQSMLLAQPIEVTAIPGARVMYNPTSTYDKNDPGWSDTFSETGAFKIILPENYTMIAGGIEEVKFIANFKTPPISSFDEILTISGNGVLKTKIYSSSVISSDGFIGSEALFSTKGTGIKTVVFNDINKNGIKDGNEQFSVNREVKVYDNITFQLLETGYTNRNGEFLIFDTETSKLNPNKTYNIQVQGVGNEVFTTGKGVVNTNASGQANAISPNKSTIYAGSVLNYNVKFDSNKLGATTVVDQITAAGGLINEPTTPLYHGYTFLGWTSERDYVDGMKFWDFKTDTMPPEDTTLYGQWALTKYTVKFYGDGAMNTPPDQEIEFGALVNEPYIPLFPGYTFIGWADQSTGDEWDFSNDQVTDDLNLEARWRKNSYTVVYVPNGAPDLNIPGETVAYGSYISRPDDPSRVGYDFIGWSESEDDKSNIWNFDFNTMPADDKYLFAQWEAKEYTYTFIPVLGLPAPKPLTVKYDQLVPYVDGEEKFGYVFLGWEQISPTEIVGVDSMWEFYNDLMPASDVVVRAKYNRVKVPMYYDGNGASNAPPVSENYYTGDLVTDPQVEMILNGYNFIGWSADKNGSNNLWDFNTMVLPDDQSLTLYAQWEPKEYNVTYVGTYGIVPPSPEIVKFKEYVTDQSGQTAIGYTFGGWELEDQEVGVRIWDFKDEQMPANDITLKAIWNPNPYTIKFNANGSNEQVPDDQIILYDNLASDPGMFNYEGYKFIGWSQTNDKNDLWDFNTDKMPADSIILYAQWEPKSYNLSFVTEGSSIIPDQVVEFNQLGSEPSSVPLYYGHTFISWNKKDGSEWDFKNDRMPADHVELYAKWEINKFNVTFDGNGADSPNPSSKIVEYDSLVAAPISIERLGYDFVGWEYNDDPWDFNADKMPNNDVELVAKWKKHIYEVRYDFNLANTTNVVEQVEFESLLTRPTPVDNHGYSIVSWNKNDGSKWDFQTDLMPSDNLNLYAVWAPNVHTVSYVNALSSNVPSDELVSYSNLVTKPNDLEQRGYIFIGWKEDTPNYVGPDIMWDYQNDLMPDNDVTLYAVWQKDKYNIKFNVSGATGEVVDDQVVEFDELIPDPVMIKRDGYDLVGWSEGKVDPNALWDFTTDRVPSNDVELFAVWVPKTYTLYFNTQKDGAPVASQNVVFGQLAYEINVERTGYTFTGWSQKGFDIIAPGDLVWNFMIDTMPSKDVHLYSTWSINKYDVIFNSNGASSTAPSEQEVFYDDLITDPGTLIRDGYTLIGWSENNDPTNLWNFINDKMPADQVELFAQWQVNKYNVTYDGNGAELGNHPSELVDYNSSVTNPGLIQRTGYDFVGFEYEGKLWDFNVDKMPANDINLKAIWKIKSLNVIFDSNIPGQSLLTEESVEYNNLVNQPENPKRDGYTFVKWVTEDGSTWDFANSLVNKDTHLYAEWERMQYKVIFNMTGSPFPGPETQYVYSGEKVMHPGFVEYPDHRFVGWNLSEFGTADYWDFDNNVELGLMDQSEELILYAIWDDTEIKDDILFNVVYDLNGGTGIVPPSEKIPANQFLTKPTDVPVKPGYDFDGWYIVEGQNIIWNFDAYPMLDKDIVLYANWVAKNYLVKFDMNGSLNEVPAEQTVKYMQKINDPGVVERPQYGFVGWNTNKDGSGEYWNFDIDQIGDLADGDMTLYAIWDNQKHVVSYDLNGGTGVKPADESVASGQLITKPVDIPTLENYSFSGWYYNEHGVENIWNFENDQMLTHDITLYAKWSKEAYNVTYHFNYPISSRSILTHNAEVGSKIPEPTGVTFNSHTLVGWNSIANGEGSMWDFTNHVMPAQNIHLYAQWVPTSYVVDFDTNKFPIDGVPSQSFQFGSLLTNPQINVPKGYIFNGWSTGALIKDKLWDFTTDTTPNNNLTLYAQWTRQSYNVAYDLNGGSGNIPNSESIVYGDLINQPPVNPVKENHRFIGWIYNNMLWDFSNMTMPNEDIMLVAMYEYINDEVVVQGDTNIVKDEVVSLEEPILVKTGDSVLEALTLGFTLIVVGIYLGLKKYL